MQKYGDAFSKSSSIFSKVNGYCVCLRRLQIIVMPFGVKGQSQMQLESVYARQHELFLYYVIELLPIVYHD